MNQNQPKTNPLAILAEYEAAATELKRVKRFTSRRTEFVKIGTEPQPTPAPYPQTGTVLIDSRPESPRQVWPEWDAIQARLAALPTPPDRAEVEAACLAELQALTDEFAEMGRQTRALVEAEMLAAIEVESARIRQRYAQRWTILGLSTKNEAVELAQAALERSENKTRIPGNRRRDILDQTARLYPGADLTRPETWPAAAAARVEAALGELYSQAEAATARRALGLSDNALGQLLKSFKG